MMDTTIIAFIFIIFQVTKTEDPFIEDLKIPQPSMGEFCGYESCQRVKEDALNIHLVPSTLYELGFNKQFEEFYTGVDANDLFLKSEINMKKTLDVTVSELWEDNTRRFALSDLPYFFHWWKERDGSVRRMVHELVRQGRLMFVGGGWGLVDESNAGYQSILDSFTFGLRKLNTTFGECGRPLVAWQVDSFGHSREVANLLAGMGFDAIFINPISYDDEINRMAKKALEFVWRGSDDLGRESDIFTHKLFDGYWPPPGLCFDNYCKDDLIVDSDNTMSNVQEKVQEFIRATVHRQAPYYRTNNIIIIMGARFAYYDARKWFRNIDRLIKHANNQAFNYGVNIYAFYSSPACYLRAVYNENPLFPIKQDDFLPIAHTHNDYFVGLYSSRPTFKYMVKVSNIFFQIAKQLAVTAGLGNQDKELEFIKWTMGVVQDRNILSGAHRPHVAQYYKTKLYISTQKSSNIMRKAFNKIRGVDSGIRYYRCLFNESECMNTNSERSYIIVYNPLGWPVSVNVRIPTSSPEYMITDSYGEFIDATVMPIPEQILQLPLRRTTANIEVVFIAENVPPLGFTSYFIQLKPIVNRRVLKSANFDETSYISIEEEEFNVTDNPNKNVTNSFKTFNFGENNEDPDNEESIDVKENFSTNVNFDKNYQSNDTNTTTIKQEQLNKTYNEVIYNITLTNTDNNENEENSTITGNETNINATDNNTGLKDLNFIFFPKTEEHIPTESINSTTNYSNRRVIPLSLGSQDIFLNKTKVKKIFKSKKPILETTTPMLKETKLKNFILSPEEESEQINKTKALISKFYFGNNKTVPGKIYFYKHIKNKFLKIELDKKGYRIAKVVLINGSEIFLDIEFCYYEAFSSNYTRDKKLSSGPYIFKPKTRNPLPIFDKHKPKIFVSKIVNEIHIKYAEFASIVVRLYNYSSVIEVDWMVGPIPMDDGIGKEIVLKYKTDLQNENTFYTDSNGRQTIKRRVNERPTWEYRHIRNVVGNYYPVNSKIYIEDIEKNIRFSVFNDRPQGGSSSKDGEIELMIHRRLLTEESNSNFILNETVGDSGLIVRGKHHIFISETDSNLNRIFEKKLVKEIQLSPQILVSKSEPKILLRHFLKFNNQFSALKSKLPLGIHLLTLEPWSENNFLIRFENYLEKCDIGNKSTKKIYLKGMFENLKILDVKETTLGANMWKGQLNPLQWEVETPFVNNFNKHYGSEHLKEFADDEYFDNSVKDWREGIRLLPMEIKTFIVTYMFQI